MTMGHSFSVGHWFIARRQACKMLLQISLHLKLRLFSKCTRKFKIEVRSFCFEIKQDAAECGLGRPTNNFVSNSAASLHSVHTLRTQQQVVVVNT